LNFGYENCSVLGMAAESPQPIEAPKLRGFNWRGLGANSPTAKALSGMLIWAFAGTPKF
jgi:hypothetical protein